VTDGRVDEEKFFFPHALSKEKRNRPLQVGKLQEKLVRLLKTNTVFVSRRLQKPLHPCAFFVCAISSTIHVRNVAMKDLLSFESD